MINIFKKYSTKEKDEKLFDGNDGLFKEILLKNTINTSDIVDIFPRVYTITHSTQYEYFSFSYFMIRAYW